MSDLAQDNDSALLRLMQLVSPALPVGAYAYSQGMEYAVHAAWLHDEGTVSEWILDLLQQSLARVDVPMLARLYRAWMNDDDEAVLYWSAYLRACRESRELQEEESQMGRALARLLRDLNIAAAEPWINHPASGFAVMFSMGGEPGGGRDQAGAPGADCGAAHPVASERGDPCCSEPGLGRA